MSPVVAVVLAIFLLKERMTARKGISLVLGFAGALVILQPGSSIEPGILLALGSGVCFGFYMIATRHAATNSDPVKTLAFQCVVGALLLAPQAAATWSTPAWSDLVFFAGLGLFSARPPHVDCRLPLRRHLGSVTSPSPRSPLSL